MLRILVAIAFLVALAWYLTRDAGPRPDVAEQQREQLEEARATADFAEQAQEAAAMQTDAIRDAAMGAQPRGEGSEGDEDSNAAP